MRKRPPRVLRAIHYWGHRVLPFLFLAAGTFIAYRVWNFGDEGGRCASMPAQLPDPALFVVGIAALLLGRVFSHFDDAKSDFGGPSKWSSNVTQFALLATFFVFGLAWFFEALGTAEVAIVGSARAEAISFYVRCAIYLDKGFGTGGILTAAIIALLCFVAGHWLWADHPTAEAASPRPRRVRSSS